MDIGRNTEEGVTKISTAMISCKDEKTVKGIKLLKVAVMLIYPLKPQNHISRVLQLPNTPYEDMENKSENGVVNHLI